MEGIAVNIHMLMVALLNRLLQQISKHLRRTLAQLACFRRFNRPAQVLQVFMVLCGGGGIDWCVFIFYG